jgi:hypothetical protein
VLDLPFDNLARNCHVRTKASVLVILTTSIPSVGDGELKRALVMAGIQALDVVLILVDLAIDPLLELLGNSPNEAPVISGALSSLAQLLNQNSHCVTHQ